jgi:TIM-barrel protein
MSLFSPPVALASLSGESDAAWARAGADHAGAAFLGGVALDEPTREAARAMVERDRTEFLPEDPVAFVEDQLDALADTPIRPGVNVRTVSLAPLQAVGAVCAAHDAILEVNAHCRQDEMCAAGAGETVLRDAARLRAQVATAADTGATVSVKVRAEVSGVDLPALARSLEAAGAAAIHVDAMDSEAVVGDVAAAVDRAAVVANNGVRDAATTREYLEYGADAVSVGRASDDPAVLAAVREAAEAWFDDREGSAGACGPPTEAGL